MSSIHKYINRIIHPLKISTQTTSLNTIYFLQQRFFQSFTKAKMSEC